LPNARSTAVRMVLVGLIAVLNGCGTSGASKTDDAGYFASLSKINAQFEARALNAGVQYSHSNSAAEDKTALAAYAHVTDAFVAQLRSLSAPPDLADLNGRLIGTVQDLSRSVGAFEHSRASGQTETDLAPFALDFDEKSRAVSAACGALQSRADAQHVAEDLRCQMITGNNADSPKS
jgi:hypothetical protein